MQMEDAKIPYIYITYISEKAIQYFLFIIV